MPIKYKLKAMVSSKTPKNALVAQLDRATDFGSVGCGFDSYRARHFCREFLAFCTDFVGFGFWRKAEFALLTAIKISSAHGIYALIAQPDRATAF